MNQTILQRMMCWLVLKVLVFVIKTAPDISSLNARLTTINNLAPKSIKTIGSSIATADAVATTLQRHFPSYDPLRDGVDTYRLVQLLKERKK